MEKLLTYNDGEYTLNVGDSFDINETNLMILDLFILYGKTYVSYDYLNEQKLLTDLVDEFINDKKEYFNTIITRQINENECCSCGEKH